MRKPTSTSGGRTAPICAMPAITWSAGPRSACGGPPGSACTRRCFPPGFPVADAAAAALALDSELDWIKPYVLDTLRGQAGSIAR